MGLGYLVFPGATHTRAAHSVGTMHVAGRIADHLELSDEETQRLRLAALLHDIGQYPLSHCVELTYRMIGDPERETVRVKETATGLLAASTKTDVLDSMTDLQQVGVMAPTSRAADDKRLGGHLIRNRPDLREILDREGGDYAEEVAALVEERFPDPLFNSILSSDYDADRLDYVQRDAKAVGMPYGELDLDFFIECMGASSDDPRKMVFHERKGLTVLEHYLLARYFVYSQITFNKTIRSLELMAKALVLRLAKEGRIYSDFRKIRAVADSDEFLGFTDSYFFNAVRDAAEDPPSEEAGMLATKLLSREPLGFVAEMRRFVDDEDAEFNDAFNEMVHRQGWREEIASDAGVSPTEIVVEAVPDLVLVPLSKSLGAAEAQRMLSESGDEAREYIEEHQSAPRLSDGNLLVDNKASLMRVLDNRRLRVLRVYLTTMDEARRSNLRTTLSDRYRGFSTS